MPLFWLALAFALGILASSLLPISWPVWAGLIVASLLLPYLLRRLPLPLQFRDGLKWLARDYRGSMLAPLVILVALLAGGLRSELARPSFTPHDLAYYNGQGFARVTGVVDQPPGSGSGKVNLNVSSRQILLNGQTIPLNIHGALLVAAPTGTDWRYGDLVEVNGKLEAPPEEGDFSYRAYLARQGVYSWAPFAAVIRLESGQGQPFQSALFAFRQRMQASLLTLFPPPESSLLVGILLGDDSLLPDDLMHSFKDTGTSHIIAISGFNIAILAGLFAALFSRLFGTRWGSLAAILAIAVYTLMVGAGASVVRAAIMGGLSLLAVQLGRRQMGLNTLGLTGLAMCLANPGWLADVGFQLSFMATLGLVVFAEPLQAACGRLAERIFRWKLPQRALDLFGEAALLTLAAQLTTWPVQIVHFRYFSPIALPANLLILPPQPLVMVLGGMAALGGMLAQPLGQALALVAWPFVAYTIRLVELFASLPAISIATGPVNLFLVGLYYLALFGLAFYSARLRPWLAAIAPNAGILGLAALSALTWRTASLQADQRLRLTLLPGNGQTAIFIQAPGGQSLLVNGGSSAPALSRSIGERLPPFSRRLDALLVTRASGDALSALPETVRLYPPGLVLWVGDPLESQAGLDTRAALLANQRRIQAAQPGMALDLNAGVFLRVLGPRGGAPSGLLLEWGSFRALAPLAEIEGLPADLHGVSLLLLDAAALKSAPPETWQAVFHSQALAWDGNAGSAPDWALDTRNYRWLQFSTDGEQMWIEGRKHSPN
ncbi:MAG: ComEC/Rec2 family competence protein [Anaerolineaceae bacterium]|nr:ComEC/Rec2 family competence protein [Anaerolineaceae bacterium]